MTQNTPPLSGLVGPPPPTPLAGLSFPQINLAEVVAFYEDRVSRAVSQVEGERFSEALATIAEAAKIAYLVNWRYHDDRLEDALAGVSAALLERVSHASTDGERIVFFDSWGFDSRGLSLQYIRALKAFGAPLLFICESRNDAASFRLRRELRRAPAAEILYLDDISDKVEKARRIHEGVAVFQPTLIVMHMTPWAVEPIVAFHAFPGVRKYQVNLTDHAFWLGAGCTDYSLEFREYGRTITGTKRNIPASRAILNPYYPVVEDSQKGTLPGRRPGEIVVFTGGAFYKMYGRNGYFFDLIASILNDHDDVVVWIAGNGRTTFLEKRLLPYLVRGRIKLIGNRKDINAVFKACDLYLSTYPFCGGLMAQLAAVHEKPILSFTSADLVTNYLEDIIGTAEMPQTTTTNPEEFEHIASGLIKDGELRKRRARATKAAMHNRADFEARVFDILSYPDALPELPVKPLEIDYHAVTSLYLEIENRFQDQLARRILHSTNLRSTVKFPLLTAKAVLQVACFIALNSRKWGRAATTRCLSTQTFLHEK